MGDSSLPVLPVTENYWLQEITGYRDRVPDRVAQGHFGYRKFRPMSGLDMAISKATTRQPCLITHLTTL